MAEELGNIQNEAKAVVNEDVNQLIIELERLAEGGDSVKFGTLFHDNRCQGIFEAIVGTLKAAKKRGLIDFQGEMLLAGAHDDVEIKILKQSVAPPEEAPAAQELASPDEAPASPKEAPVSPKEAPVSPKEEPASPKEAPAAQELASPDEAP